jgi:hypothetical protein
MGTTPWIETLIDLHSASSAEELWSVLLAWHGIRSSTQWDEAYSLLHRFHAEEPEGAIVTAVLLCTDYRWRKASHHLIARIVESGVLAESDEDQLAEWFVGAALELPVEHDPSGGADVELADESEGADHPLGADEPAAVGLRRPIWPPLRRWAAARLVARDPCRWRALLDSAEAMASRDAAALAAGVMDAAAHIPPEERPEAVTAGLRSGSGTVRLAALPVFAALEGTEAALARARADSSAKVRAWGPRASVIPPRSEHPEGTPVPARAEGPRPMAGQDSLF